MTFAYSPLKDPRAAPVGAAGLEPAASSLSGMRSDRLSYAPPRGAGRARTGGLPVANRTLSQLSYGPAQGRAGRAERLRRTGPGPRGAPGAPAGPSRFERR